MPTRIRYIISMNDKKTGTLYLVATPIGNLSDMTFRAVETLRSVGLIAAEDTRHSRILLDHYGVVTPVTSYHEHNKYEKAETLAAKLAEGTDIALITDAGTPAISDPGEVLVRLCKDRGIPVTSLPGPCAAVTALTLSGLSTRRFAFEGFLPADRSERAAVLERLRGEERTIVLYEAPHRLAKTLSQLLDALGDRRVCVCRELTKVHEEAPEMLLSEAAAIYDGDNARGEFVLVIEGADPEERAAAERSRWEEMSLSEHLAIYLEQGLGKKDAMKQMAADRNCSKRDIYNGLLEEEKTPAEGPEPAR